MGQGQYHGAHHPGIRHRGPLLETGLPGIFGQDRKPIDPPRRRLRHPAEDAAGRGLEPHTFRIHISEVADDEIAVGSLLITVLPLDHAPESVGYRIESPDGRAVVYSGDTDYCANIVELARGAGLLLLECSFPD